MDTRTFVSDALLRLTGASDPTIIDFFLATASEARSVTSLRDKLAPFLEGDEREIDLFCADLWSRVGHHDPAPSANVSSSSASTKKKYALVDMDDDSDLSALGPAPSRDRESKKRKEKSTSAIQSSRWADDFGETSASGRDRDDGRKRERSPDDEDRDHRHRRSRKLRRRDMDDFEDRWGDEEIPPEEEYADEAASTFGRTEGTDHDGAASPAKTTSSEELDEEARAERERQRDLKERDEFAKRLAQKDEERSKKKIVEDRTRRGDAADRRALADDPKAREAIMPELRLRSRQEYLKKREAERLALLRRHYVYCS